MIVGVLVIVKVGVFVGELVSVAVEVGVGVQVSVGVEVGVGAATVKAVTSVSEMMKKPEVVPAMVEVELSHSVATLKFPPPA